MSGSTGFCASVPGRPPNRPSLASAARARTHLSRLHLAGMRLSVIAELAGVPRSTVRRIAAGDQRRIRAEVESRILAVGSSALGPPTREILPLLDAMAEAGFSRARLARRLEVSTDALRLRGRTVEPGLAEKIRQLAAQVLDPEAPAGPEPDDVLAPHMRTARALGEMDFSWAEGAVCSKLGRHVQELFFGRSPDAQAAAVELCGGCPVRQPCLDVALVTGDGGVRGGTTEAERRHRGHGGAAA